MQTILGQGDRSPVFSLKTESPLPQPGHLDPEPVSFLREKLSYLILQEGLAVFQVMSL